jgi:ATP-binding cassette, subfamily B, bacterial PglK
MGFSEVKALSRLWGVIPLRRKRQLFGIFALLLVGAFAEVATIGAVLPFLQIVTDPQGMANMPLVGEQFARWALVPPGTLVLASASFLIVVALLSMALRLVLLWVLQRFSQGLGHDFGLEIFRRTIRQPYAQFVRSNSSEVLSGLEKVNILANGLILSIMQGLSSVVIASFIIVTLFLIDPRVALIAGGLVGGLYLLISLLTGRSMLRMSKRSAAIMPRRVKLVEEGMGGLRDIILDQSHDMFEQRFAKMDSEWRAMTARFNFISNAPRLLVEAVGIFLIAALAVFYSRQPGGVAAALPVLGAFAVGAQRLLPLIQTVYLGWSQLSAYAYSVNDVVDLTTRPIQALPRRPRATAPQPFGDHIEIQDVSFSYDGRTPALENIDLTIRKGERVGFVGKTGSGKSTLLDLIMGFLEPSSGQILVGGKRLGRATMQNWQAQIAHVPQSIFLADDSITANIAFGSEPGQIDLERVRDAARRAGLAAFIEQLGEGYATTVGQRGIRLSGGQRQRIGIARALYKRATVLVLDEATSALDDKTEAAVMEAITALDRDLTILMIAHRLSTVAMCDTIVKLDDGRIVERGSFAEVIGRAA